MDWLTFVVVDPVKAMLVKVMGYIPSLAGAIVILLVGWLLAKLLEAVVVRVLKAIKLDMVSDKAGIAKVLSQGEIRMSLSELLGAVVYWIVTLMVIATALNALNLTIAADLVSKLVEYVPNILGAIFILLAGAMVANFVGTMVRTAASNAGVANAKLLGQVTQTVLVIVAIVIAIEQLKIASTLIVLAVNVILISIGIGAALAFGLGCKEIAGKAMSEFLNSFKK
jgi:hypothetical protein